MRPHVSRVAEVLLVEDNPGDVDLVKEGLLESPVEVRLHVVEDGEEALAFLGRRSAHAGAPQPDLVLLDLNLPVKDGREVLREIRSSLRRTTPVVVLTGSDAEEDVQEAYRLGANGYVVKSADLDEHLARIRATAGFWLHAARLPQRGRR